ncbi:MAG: cytochrome c/ABC transporter substrate-binding protein, partial [Blastocatellia bacterium]
MARKRIYPRALKAFPTYKRLIALAAVLGACFWLFAGERSEAQTANRLSDAQARGRKIYEHGISSSGKTIFATLGETGAEVPAGILPCANCHGLDGHGKPEGGVTPPDLVWDSLTKPYTITTDSGRRRSPYNDSLLKRAITMGVDSGGNKLAVAMPRFQMSIEDISDLVAYIKTIGRENAPGITGDSITLGSVVSKNGPLAGIGADVNATLKAYFDAVNSSGGVYGRTIKLKVIEPTSNDTPEQPDDGAVFAVVSSVAGAADDDFVRHCERDRIPAVFAFQPVSKSSAAPDRYAFYLYPGLGEQTRALCVFAARHFGAEAVRASVVYPDSPSIDALRSSIQAESKTLGLRPPVEYSYGQTQPGIDFSALANELSRAGINTVVLLASAGNTREFLKQAGQLQWNPTILLVGELAGPNLDSIPSTFKGKVFEAFPTLPSDWSSDALASFSMLAKKSNLGQTHLEAQFSALAAASTIVTILKATGKDITREQLVTALEHLY